MESIQISDDTIRAFQNGNRSAFHEIYLATSSYIFNVVVKLTRNTQEAEDLAHDIYIKIYDARQKYNFSSQFTTWIYRIAVNHTLNQLKRNQTFLKKQNSSFFGVEKPKIISPIWNLQTQ
ncbi:RNA polymerase sigma factor [bacterium]|nr:RNA polymerase sigma factor [bacterium]